MERTGEGKRLRRLCVVAALLFLAYGCLLATQSVRGLVPSPAPHSLWPLLVDKPVGEDGYYMLTVAENLATTHHLAYNYGLTATGIQPLATFVYAAIAVVTNA